MVTAVSRRLTTAALGIAVLVPSGVLLAAPALAEDEVATPTSDIGEAVYEEATPDPVTGLYPGQFVPATESSPATPGWITGGTLQEGVVAAPVTKPAAKPAVKPAVKPVAQPVTAPVQGPSARRTSTTSPVGEPTALPFTGPERLLAQLGAGAALVLGGAFVLVAARPRRTA